MITARPQALVMPGADLWAGLALGPLPGRVTVDIGDHHIEYENQPGADSLTLSGQMDGQPFEIQATPAEGNALAFRGDTPLGPVDTLERAGGGGFGFDGTVGGMEVSEVLALDMSGGTSGHLAYLGGTIHGDEYHAYATKKDDGTVELHGTLGGCPVDETVRMGAGGMWIIEGQIAGMKLKETILRYS